jgi:hypothetical protein
MNFCPPIYPPLIPGFVWIAEDFFGLKNKKALYNKGLCGYLRITQYTILYSGSALSLAQSTPSIPPRFA